MSVVPFPGKEDGGDGPGGTILEQRVERLPRVPLRSNRGPSLRGAQRPSNPAFSAVTKAGLLRSARNDDFTKTQLALEKILGWLELRITEILLAGAKQADIQKVQVDLAMMKATHP